VKRSKVVDKSAGDLSELNEDDVEFVRSLRVYQEQMDEAMQQRESNFQAYVPAAEDLNSFPVK
jgi:hypothetical protein